MALLPTEAASPIPPPGLPAGAAPVYGFTFPLVLLAAVASLAIAPAKIHLVTPISPLGFVVFVTQPR